MTLTEEEKKMLKNVFMELKISRLQDEERLQTEYAIGAEGFYEDEQQFLEEQGIQVESAEELGFPSTDEND